MVRCSFVPGEPRRYPPHSNMNKQEVRKWFRLRLRTLLVLVTIFCVWLGYGLAAAKRIQTKVEQLHQDHVLVSTWHHTSTSSFASIFGMRENILRLLPYFAIRPEDMTISPAMSERDLPKIIDVLKQLTTIKKIHVADETLTKKAFDSLTDSLPNVQITGSPIKPM